MEHTEPHSDWMFSCPIKAVTGVDCPGCGFQRASYSLVKGDVGGAWSHYPPLFPFLLTMILLIVALRTRFRGRLRLLFGSFIFTILFVGVHYAYKMMALNP